MSTTTNRAVSMMYASQPGKPGLIFEMQMGMVDRGCMLDWISQYQGEAEVLFAPLTGIEVQATRIEGSVLVVEARLSINLNALTLEQVISKRRKVLHDMMHDMQADLKRVRPLPFAEEALAAGMQGIFTHLQADAGLDLGKPKSAEWFNKDANFVKSVATALEVKQAASREPERLVQLLAAVPDEQLLPHVGRCLTSAASPQQEERALFFFGLGLLSTGGQAAMAPHAAEVAAHLQNHRPQVRVAVLDFLALLEPALLDNYADEVVIRLQDTDSVVRRAALLAMRRLGPAALTRHADLLANCLLDPNWRDDLAAAVSTLGRLSPAALKPHAVALLELIYNAEADVCAIAIEALGRLASTETEATPATFCTALEHCLARPEPSVRLAAVRVLGKQDVGSPSQPAHRVLLACLRHADRNVRRLVVPFLNALAPEQRILNLLPLADDPDAAVRLAAVHSLDEGDTAKLTPHTDLLVRRLDDDDDLTRWRATSALGRLPSTELEKQLPILVSHLSDGHPHVRVAVIQALGRLEQTRRGQLQDTLVRCLEDSESVVRAAALHVLSGVHPAAQPSHAAAIARLVTHLSEDVRTAAIDGLAALDPALAVDALGALPDPDEPAAASETTSEAQTSGPGGGAPQTNLERWLAHSELGVRCAALDAVGRLEGALAGNLPVLMTCLKSPKSPIRLSAVRALSRHVDDGTLMQQLAPVLVLCLKDEDAEIRRITVLAFGRLTQLALERYAAQLEKRLKDGSKGVRIASLQVLGKLRPMDLASSAPSLVGCLADQERRADCGAFSYGPFGCSRPRRARRRRHATPRRRRGSRAARHSAPTGSAAPRRAADTCVPPGSSPPCGS
uniref:Uncharacterized protein n=1 Tax=Haptolina brevifila TaxID=156173 RepID=A0A7S2CY98_9EUKA|mmetsp:Transcript_30437/g.61147  ORF Transcript_30437/g.61147 Transcript_30437/m.61147 type:complete len:850 (+) Transcript_30437:1008-3557(+)